MKKTKRLLIYGNIIAVILLVAFVIVSDILMDHNFKCALASSLYMYCPGCGGTRAVYSLLHFDIISAIRYNIVVPLGLIIYIYYNVKAIISIIKHEDDFINRQKFIPMYIFIGVLLLNFVLRNVLLWGFGIDLIGDFLPKA